MYIKHVFKIIAYFKRQMIIFFLLGSMVGLGEYFLLKYIPEIYSSLVIFSGSSVLAVAGLGIGYLVILVIGFVLIYATRKQAFSMAMEFILHLVTEEKQNDFVRNPEGLSRVLTVERERLAREVVSPILSIITKILMPVVVIGYIIISRPFAGSNIVLPAVILILAFIVSSSMFAHFARKLEVGLKELGLFTHTFMRTYDSSARKMKNSEVMFKAKVANKTVSNSEGYIDVFSQLPRQSIDLSIYVFILFSLLSGSNTESESTSLLFLSPLLIRAISAIQAIYKCYASIRSNVGSLSVLTGENIAKPQAKPFAKEKMRVLINVNESNLLTTSNSKKSGRTIGIQLPSGYGKTNAVLNLFYSGLNLPSAMTLDVVGCDISDIGYVPSDPFFDQELLKATTKIDSHFKNFFDDILLPESSDPLKCSAGELFRWNLYIEMANNPRLLIVDESIIHASQVHQRKILEYFSSGKTSTSLIIITHSRELMLQCKLQIY